MPFNDTIDPAVSHPADQTLVLLNGHHFHHSQITQALDLHATQARMQAANAVAKHDGHMPNANVGCVGTQATL